MQQSLPLPRIACHILVEKNDQLLLLRRIKEPYKGLLAVPGGKLEPGEFLLDCAKRELREETGLVAEDIALKLQIHETSESPDWQWIVMFYHCTAFSGTLQKDGPEGQLDWYSTHDIANIDCSPVDKMIYQRALSLSEGEFESLNLFFHNPHDYEIR
jgi:8-oxo-dGTP diphosphatase